MYSTIQEAWNNDHMELYTNNFKQSKFNTPSSNNYFNIHENYGGIITKKKPNKSTRQVRNTSSTISNLKSTNFTKKYKPKKKRK